MESEHKNKKKEAISLFLEKNILLGNDIINKIDEEFDAENFYNWVSSKSKGSNIMFLDYNIVELFNKKRIELDWKDIEKAKVREEKGTEKGKYNSFMESFMASDSSSENHSKKTSVNVMFLYNKEPKKKEIVDFVYLFNKRYEAIKKVLMNRQELQGAASITRIIGKKDRGACSLIGTVLDKSITSNNNIILSLEDQSGVIKVFIGKNKPELYEIGREITLDEVIGVVGTNGDNIIFANNIILPEMPAHKEIKKAPDKSHIVFLSDLHIGSTKFLPDEFNKFLLWIKGESGTEAQREIASNVNYIFIVGDVVDGVGVYPEQELELEIKDIYAQYEECARLLKEIPKRIKIIICPGNHDALRLSEPQPPLSKDFAKALWDMENVVMVSNPALININSSEKFPGFDVLMYHGYSFDYYVANVDTIREKGGYDRADLIMKFLLQRRHLAPSYTSTLYVADPEKDHLVIERVPDFFVTGHIHKSYAANYRNITMICGSCWQSKTIFQEKVGHNPEPARVPIVDLNTRKVKILRFDK